MNREQLIKELLNKKLIKIGESINYTKFKQIHSNGYSHISEYDFAEMLGINSGNFNNVKNKGQNAIILKELIPMQEEKIAKEISEDLLKKLEAGQRINYEQFCSLRENYCVIYGDISEAKFGRILELNDDALYHLRKGKEIPIFKSKFSSETIIQSLIQEGISVPGDKINYSKFSEMYEKARKKHPSINHFSQYAFAKLLGIRKSTFTKFKTTSVNLQILKNYMPKKKRAYVVSDEERMLIVENLIRTKNAKPYEFCDYQRFLELYQGYENILEYNFAYILDMSSTSFSKIKNSGQKARILKDCLDKDQIIAELIASGKLQIGQEIDYTKFSELFKEYEYLGVFLFADIIEVSEGNIERLRTTPGSTTIALRSRIKKEEQETSYNDIREQAKAYVKELFEIGRIHIGQEIDYKSFKELYFECSYISENEFAKLLGISGLRYQNIRYSGTKTYIHDYKVIEAVKLIGNIEKNRYFSKDEIEDICNEYGITKEDFITYFVYSKNFRYNSNLQAYVDILERHNQIYIGKARMSNEYFEKAYPLFAEPIKRLVGTMCKKYRMLRYIEDFESESFMYMIQNCGDIEKNFSDCKDNQTLINMIIGRLKIFLREKIINQLKISAKSKSTSLFYTRRDNKEYIIPDNNINTEETALESVVDDTTESKVMCELIRRFENGMDKTELLESIQVDFGISKESLLGLLSKRIELKKKNKGTVDVSIGE